MNAERELFLARQRFFRCEYPPALPALWADVEYWESRLVARSA